MFNINRLSKIVPPLVSCAGRIAKPNMNVRLLTVLPEQLNPIATKMDHAILIPMHHVREFETQRLLGGGREARVYKGSMTVTNELNEYKKKEVAFRISLASLQRPPFIMSLIGKCFKSIDQINKEAIRLVVENEYNHFKNQIALTSELDNCPYIVKYVVSEPLITTGRQVRGIIEVCQGSFEKMLTQEMDFSKLLKFIADASEGVAALHEKGYIHSDIKPENLFISLDGSTGLLGDFGMTTKIGEKSKGGTLHYWRNNTDQEFNTKDKDLYALALTTKDIINLSGFIDSSNTTHLAFKNEINQFIEGQLNQETQIPANEFTHQMRRFHEKAQKIGFKPLGDTNLQESLRMIQSIRAGIATGFLAGNI